jgi:hypothetical protein
VWSAKPESLDARRFIRLVSRADLFAGGFGSLSLSSPNCGPLLWLLGFVIDQNQRPCGECAHSFEIAIEVIFRRKWSRLINNTKEFSPILRRCATEMRDRRNNP